jgi:proline iminopeptidase
LSSCASPSERQQSTSHESYFENKDSGLQTGGIKIIPIETPKGKFNVWTKTIGNNPKARLLLLNGGPGATHEYFECFESFLPAEGIEIIYYDHLGCGNSDNPNDTSFWIFQDIVGGSKQVRKALNLTNEKFLLIRTFLVVAFLLWKYALKYQHKPERTCYFKYDVERG